MKYKMFILVNANAEINHTETLIVSQHYHQVESTCLNSIICKLCFICWLYHTKAHWGKQSRESKTM